MISKQEIFQHNALYKQIENTLTTYDPHALIIVYSVDDLESFNTACDSLAYLKSQHCSERRAKILVANKIDLQRSRVVSVQGTKKKFYCHVLSKQYLRTSQ